MFFLSEFEKYFFSGMVSVSKRLAMFVSTQVGKTINALNILDPLLHTYLEPSPRSCYQKQTQLCRFLEILDLKKIGRTSINPL